jgi:hypothetical protein
MEIALDASAPCFALVFPSSAAPTGLCTTELFHPSDGGYIVNEIIGTEWTPLSPSYAGQDHLLVRFLIEVCVS